MNNYHHLFKEEVASLNGRKRLLLHVCCGPCSMYPLELLSQYFDITIYYANSNIYPYEEYEKRLHELLRYLESFENDLQVVIPKYDNATFTASLSPYKDCQEGEKRCVKCYGLRLKETFAYAKAHHFDYCTTLMSISNRKNATYINELGRLFEKEYGVPFLYNDFKKDGGIAKNQMLNKAFDLYHQDYCGCIYSYQTKKLR